MKPTYAIQYYVPCIQEHLMVTVKSVSNEWQTMSDLSTWIENFLHPDLDIEFQGIQPYET